MKTTIVTVNHDTKQFIELCIKAVHLNTTDYEHVIIDNGSKPDTINVLNTFAAKGWIKLIRHNLTKNSAGHAAALNWFLRESQRNFDLVCTLDSDAFPFVNGWLGTLKNWMGDADAVGFPHYRDSNLLHPACMLFRYSAYAAAGKPLWNIRNGKPFIDTGMNVCTAMKSVGKILKPTNETNSLVRHRWCATRAEVAKGPKLDDTPINEYNSKSDQWFQDPIVTEILKHN